jgi:apolipoprotein D and lipocalin family protein
MKILTLALLMIMGCSTNSYKKTVEFVERDRFMGTWYVQAGRFTPFEKGVHNGVENYSWNEKEERIDISFTYNKDSLTGELKSVPQKGWIHNKETNAHWKVSPFWPLKFHFLVIALGTNYEWTAIGVPDQAYLWIMTRKKNLSTQEVQKMIDEVRSLGYRTDEIVFVPHL